MKTPILKTDRLILRPFRPEDAQAVFDGWESDPDVARYMFWTSHHEIEQTRKWIAFEISQIGNPDWYRFALELKASGELIGTALIYYEEELRSWEVGYNLSKAYWDCGYTTEAMGCVLAFAKEQLGVSEVAGRYAKENPASGRVLEKLGFQYENDIPYPCNDGNIVREGILCRLKLR